MFDVSRDDFPTRRREPAKPDKYNGVQNWYAESCFCDNVNGTFITCAYCLDMYPELADGYMD